MLSFYSNMQLFTENLQFVDFNTLFDNSNKLFVYRNMQSFILKQLFCNSNTLLFNSNRQFFYPNAKSFSSDLLFDYGDIRSSNFIILFITSNISGFSKQLLIQCKRDIWHLTFPIRNPSIQTFKTLNANTLSIVVTWNLARPRMRWKTVGKQEMAWSMFLG